MAKKRGRTNRHSVKHKAKLTSLFFIKILTAFLSLGVGLIIYFLIDGFVNQLIAMVVSLGVTFSVYLILILRTIRLLKF